MLRAAYVDAALAYQALQRSRKKPYKTSCSSPCDITRDTPVLCP